MTVQLTTNDAGEVLHKLTTLAETEDLCEDYELTSEQANLLRDTVPLAGGLWTVPAWATEAVRSEMADHCLILDSIASDARSGGETGQALRISKQSKRLRKIFN
jgi:hypothetical protein